MKFLSLKEDSQSFETMKIWILLTVAPSPGNAAPEGVAVVVFGSSFGLSSIGEGTIERFGGRAMLFRTFSRVS